MVPILGKNLPLKILSVFLSVLLWAVISRGTGGETMEISLGIPLELHNLPKDMEVIRGPVERVDVRFSGPRRIVSKLSQMGLAITLDLSGAADGKKSFEIFTSDIQVPERVSVTRVTPSNVDLVLEKVQQKQVPVTLRTEGSPSTGYTIEVPRLDPAFLEIRGPGSVINGIENLFTPPVPVQGATVNIVGKIAVLVPESRVHVVGSPKVKYEIPVLKMDASTADGSGNTK